MANVEKNDLEHVETRESEGSPYNVLEKQETLRHVDLANRQAFKGDESDGKVTWTIRKAFAAVSLAMLYTGSQIPLYFAGATLTFIAKDIGAADAIGWLPVANTLTIASVCPFVGYLQDLFGKRYIALLGGLCLCVGCIILGTAHTLGQALTGMALSGAGAGIGELTGLAGLAETVPVKHRGYSLAALTAFVLPFCPYVLYSQLFSHHATWRWGAWISL
jgi:MFS family permease